MDIKYVFVKPWIEVIEASDEAKGVKKPSDINDRFLDSMINYCRQKDLKARREPSTENRIHELLSRKKY
jgi:hypothetical protein